MIVSLVKVTCFVKNTYIKDASTKRACIASTYTKRTCTRGAYISNICIKSACTRIASDKSNCIRSVCVVECSGMYLQSFWILEVGGTRLEIQVGAGCTSIRGACIEDTCIASPFARGI